MKSQWRISETDDAQQQADDSNRHPAVCANDARSPHPLLVFLLIWMWSAVAQAQLEYRVENGAITITGYSGFDGAVTIPDTIHGLPVTAIAWGTISGWSEMTSVTIPASITRIEGLVFSGCVGLTSIAVPESVTRIEIDAFSECAHVMEITVDANNTAYSSLDGVLFNKDQTVLIRIPEGRSGRYTIPDGVISIESQAFRNCASLTSVTIPASVTTIYGISFYECTSLTALYFQGDAPATYRRLGANYATLYYMPGTTGWDAYFNRRPTVLWDPRVQTSDGSVGVLTNRFGFKITASNDVMVVVEACLDLTDPTWVQLGTHTLTGGSFYFSDPQWAQHPARYYRLRTP